MDRSSSAAFSVKDICIVAFFAALTAILSQISIPLPGGVPLSLSTAAVFLAGIVAGRKRGLAAMIVYLILGAFGVPVFANMGAGLAKLIGPTGGFLLAYPVMAYIGGRAAEKEDLPTLAAGLLLGTAVNYLMGTCMYVLSTGNTLKAAFAACVFPFVITDLLKLVLAGWAGRILRRSLRKAGLL